MPAAKVAKIAVLVLLLIGAGFFFGKACQRVNQQHQLLVTLDTDFLHSLLTLLLAIAVVAITGGLVTALVRPLWIPIVAFALSSLAALIAWELSPASGLSALIYFAFSVLYSRGVAEALNNQLKFSVESMSGSQSVLLAGLAIAASVSLYFGYAAEIEERGFEFPPAVRDIITEISTAPMRAQIEAREDLTSEQRDAMAAQMSEGFEQWILSIDEMIQPYERFVPVLLAFMLFQVLAVANTLFSWVPTAVLAILFRILTTVGLATKTIEMREAVRLSID